MSNNPMIEDQSEASATSLPSNELAELFRNAKAEMINRGRTTCELMNTAGEVCLLGAIGVAGGLFSNHKYAEYAEYHHFKANETAYNAITELAAVIDPTNELEEDPIYVVWRFNDNVADTDEEVLEMLDKAIEAVS